MPANPLTREAIDYAWGQLLARAGVNRTNLPVSLLYGESTSEHPAIMVNRCRAADWEMLLAMPPNRIRWIPAREALPPGVVLPFDSPVPVLFWGENVEGTLPFAERTTDGDVVFHADIVAATFFMLSRWEETVNPARDEHVRFPAFASVAFRQGFLDQPVVDEYALIMAAWLRVLNPAIEMVPGKFRVKTSHDVDRVSPFMSAYWAIHALGGDILKRRSATRAGQTINQTIRKIAFPTQTAQFQGIRKLARISREYKLASAFYFMASEPGGFNNDYRIMSPRIKQLVCELRDQAFEIGLHPSYQTFGDLEQLKLEKSRLDSLLGESTRGGRQHFLRFRAPMTWQHWEQAGLVYDSTVSYADCEGFRCGTCHPFQPFDVEQNRQLSVWEYPLIVMDASLFHYRKLDFDEGAKRILILADRCKQVGGIFTLLWHNNSFDLGWELWAKTYSRIAEALSGMID